MITIIALAVVAFRSIFTSVVPVAIRVVRLLVPVRSAVVISSVVASVLFLVTIVQVRSRVIICSGVSTTTGVHKVVCIVAKTAWIDRCKIACGL